MRVLQLTALAYCIGFVTDVFDDGASAKMDEADGTLPGRLAPDNLDDAVPPPPPLTPIHIDRDPEGSFIDDRAAVSNLLPRACIHSVSTRRPKLTRNEQVRTHRVIAHVAKRLKASDEFHKLLQLVAARESSLQQGLVHRLSPDLEGSYSAWRKMQKTYEGNPHAADPSVWQTYGLFGMNSNYFTLVWDKTADPRVLCDAIVDVLVYRRAAARLIRQAGGNIVCKDEHGKPFNYTTKATWETVHRAVSGGKLCPSKFEETAATMKRFFRGRAQKVGLNPDQPVTLKMLGVEPDKALDGTAWTDQDKMLAGLWTEFEAIQAKEETELLAAEEARAERVKTRVAARAARKR